MKYLLLKAMDNYFDVNDAIAYSDSALKKNPQSYTYNIITTMIKAQKEVDALNWDKKGDNNRYVSYPKIERMFFVPISWSASSKSSAIWNAIPV